jgi:hypothetical protein
MAMHITTPSPIGPILLTSDGEYFAGAPRDVGGSFG